MIVGFILALRYKDNKPLVIYRNIKSQDDLVVWPRKDATVNVKES